MRYFEITEAASAILYHYTTLPNAEQILRTGHFELSVETADADKFQPEGHFYFLSTARTLTGAFHNPEFTTPAYFGEVIFNLDGNWFNSRYRSKAVDYWNYPNKTKSEAEDRIFSKKSTIGLGGVTSIHVLVNPEPVEGSSDADREHYYKTLTGYKRIAQLASIHEIPVFGYDNRKLWLHQSPKGQSIKTKSYSFLPAVYELLTKPADSQFSSDAKDVLRQIDYEYHRNSFKTQLRNDLHNEKKREYRGLVVKIFDFMRDNKIKDIPSLVEYLATKFFPQSDQPE